MLITQEFNFLSAPNYYLQSHGSKCMSLSLPIISSEIQNFHSFTKQAKAVSIITLRGFTVRLSYWNNDSKSIFVGFWQVGKLKLTNSFDEEVINI